MTTVLAVSRARSANRRAELHVSEVLLDEPFTDARVQVAQPDDHGIGVDLEPVGVVAGHTAAAEDDDPDRWHRLAG